MGPRQRPRVKRESTAHSRRSADAAMWSDSRRTSDAFGSFVVHSTSPVVKTGTLFKRGNYMWKHRLIKLHSDAMLTVSNVQDKKVKHAVSVKDAMILVEQHPKRGASGSPRSLTLGSSGPILW